MPDGELLTVNWLRHANWVNAKMR